MRNLLPLKLKNLASSLSKPLYAVGGACRNFIAELKSSETDWDICGPLSAEELCVAAENAGFNIAAVYKNTGTVLMSDEGVHYEFTSFRTDRYVRGVHSPAEVFFTDDIASDARRRDFKCNAVYYDIAKEKFEDPLNGIDDIKNGRISTAVSADKVFGEDGLRLMRLCRISAQTGFAPDEDCMNGARKHAALISDIAAERVWAELSAILNADLKYGVKDAHYKGLKLLRDTGVMKYILPELAAGDGMRQREDFHNYDVLEHTLRCVLYAPPEIRLAALLHDIGKPFCKNNYGKFARHEEEGALIAENVCRRLRVPLKTQKRVCELVRWHMYDLSGVTSENKVRKFIIRHRDILDELLLLKQADFSACKDDLSVAPCVERWKKIYEKMQNEGVPVTLKQLNVRGDELIAAGICPAETAKTLKMLLEECAIGNVANERQKLISYALARSGR